MTISKKIWALSAITAFSFTAYGCGDDSGSGSDVQPEVKCTADVCDGNVLKKCVGGKIQEDNCASRNQTCSNKQCVDPSEVPDCTEDACSEDGKTLYKCENNKVREISCDNQDKVCENKQCVDKPECSGDVYECTGNILKTCNNATHKYETKDCEKENKVCKNGEGCVSEEEAKCVEPDNPCDGTKLRSCNAETNQLDEYDCAKDNKICDKDLKQCRFECEANTFKSSCANESARWICSDNKIVSEACTGNNAKCVEGDCIEQSEKELCESQGKIWDDVNNECISASESIVGGPCHCEGNCDIIIKGSEIKAIVNKDLINISSDVKALFDRIGDDDEIKAPQFFKTNDNTIVGCDALASQVPEGMTLGCFRDSTIYFPEGLTGLLKDLPTTKITIIGKTLDLSTMIPANISTMITGIADLLAKGIQFTSPNGYCLAATIDVSGTMDTHVKAIKTEVFGWVSWIIDLNPLTSNPLDKNTGLVRKINTGDHATVVKGAAAVSNYCPEGSTLLSYSLNKPIDKSVEGNMIVDYALQLALNVDLGFDMCLKSCDSNDDCRVNEGYSCVELPNGVPTTDAEGCPVCPATKKVCFDKNNLTYFSNMTDNFAPEGDDNSNVPESCEVKKCHYSWEE